LQRDSKQASRSSYAIPAETANAAIPAAGFDVADELLANFEKPAAA
jgi:hypothetical protein